MITPNELKQMRLPLIDDGAENVNSGWENISLPTDTGRDRIWRRKRQPDAN